MPNLVDEWYEHGFMDLALSNELSNQRMTSNFCRLIQFWDEFCGQIKLGESLSLRDQLRLQQFSKREERKEKWEWEGGS